MYIYIHKFKMGLPFPMKSQDRGSKHIIQQLIKINKIKQNKDNILQFYLKNKVEDYTQLNKTG